MPLLAGGELRKNSTSEATAGYREGVRAIAPICVTAVAFGVSFGILAEAAGLGWLAPIVMSATTFGGSAQFAAVSILDNAGGVVAAATAAVLLNARYIPLGVSVAPAWREGSAWRRLVQAQLIVDESWAISARGGGRFDVPVLIGAGVALYLCWVGGTALGALAGDILGDPATLGLDAAFPALFLALLVPQLRERRALVAALAGGLIALALLPVASPGIPIIAASVACLIGLRGSASTGRHAGRAPSP